MVVSDRLTFHVDKIIRMIVQRFAFWLSTIIWLYLTVYSYILIFKIILKRTRVKMGLEDSERFAFKSPLKQKSSHLSSLL